MQTLEILENVRSSSVNAVNPFPGPRPFTSVDEAFFFGRDREASQLATMVATNNLTVLYGESGVGKSSLVNARLRKALEAVEPDWLIINFRDWPPGCHAKLKAAAREAIGAEVNDLARDVHGFARANAQPVLLALDQFEEYFLYHPKRDAPLRPTCSVGGEDAALEAELAKLANGRRGLVRVLLSLRSDGVFLLDRLRLRIPAIFANMMLLEPLDIEGAADAVCEPIKAYNKEAQNPIAVPERDSELVCALVAGAEAAEIRRRLPSRGRGVVADIPSIGHGQIVAPFLQLALQMLWHEDIVQQGQNELRLSTLRLLAGIDEARNPRVAVGLLAQRHVNKTLNCYEGDEKDVCAAMLERMVLPSGSKVAVRADDFQNIFGEGQQPYSEKLLKELSAEGERRLLREFADADNQGKPHFEILHDALATPILNWITRVREEQRADRERAEAEKRLAEQRAEAENRLAAQRAEAERRAAREREEASKREELAAANARQQARRRSRKVLTGVIGASALAIAVAAGHFVLAGRVDRLTQFAEMDSQPEFRLRLLLTLAALDKAHHYWPLTRDAHVLTVLQRLLSTSPRDGGIYQDFGISADGTRISWIKEEGEPIVVCAIVDSQTCTADAAGTNGLYSIPPPQNFPVSQSKKLLSGFTKSAVGFLDGESDPVYYEDGMLLYRRNGDWIPVDIAILVPEIENDTSIRGKASVDFAGGAMRVSINDWPANEISLAVIKSKPGSEPPFAASPMKKVNWPASTGPQDNPPPIFSSAGDFAYLERQSVTSHADRQADGARRSQEVLVVGTANGNRQIIFDKPEKGSHSRAFTPSPGAIGFSEDGRSIAAGHRYFIGNNAEAHYSVKVFPVADLTGDRGDEMVGPGGLAFSWDRPTGLIANTNTQHLVVASPRGLRWRG
jgi:hypothetical protein